MREQEEEGKENRGGTSLRSWQGALGGCWGPVVAGMQPLSSEKVGVSPPPPVRTKVGCAISGVTLPRGTAGAACSC